MPASRDVADFVAGPEHDRKGSAIETEENDILELSMKNFACSCVVGSRAAAATPARMQSRPWWQP
jgi:hypothetical protein